jgi:hypothetical protein
MGIAMVSTMYTLWVYVDGEWYEEALAGELVYVVDEAAEIDGPWKITHGDDVVLYSE